MNDNVIDILEKLGVIPVIAIEQASSALPLADALLAGGLGVAEITFRTAAAAEAIAAMKRERPQLLVAAGTILTVQNLHMARDCGAAFGVAPGFNRAIVEEAASIGFPFFPGVMTPSDIEAALSTGIAPGFGQRNRRSVWPNVASDLGAPTGQMMPELPSELAAHAASAGETSSRVPVVSSRIPNPVRADARRGESRIPVLKFFPAEACGGLTMLRAVAAPYAHTGVRFIPTGGVTEQNLPQYLAEKCVLAVGGTWIAKKEAIAAGKWDEIAANCRRAGEIVAQCRHRA
jgi:2-keto-3-deoxy-6-phosphogluconate aldolase